MKIESLIVDDEALARERIRTLLRSDPEIEIVEECASGSAAVRAIENRAPQLVFLDIQMPDLDGFGVLRAVGASRIPAVVFVTAHDEHAVRAFEFMALDYLLKPFTEQRFRQAVARAKEQVSGPQALERRIEGLLANLECRHLERLVVRDSGRISFLRVDEIRWIESQGNYVKVHADGEAPLLRQSMRVLADRLDPARFLRIHRSTIVNIDRVRELRPRVHGEYTVVMDDSTELVSNRGFRRELERGFRDSFRGRP